jgi:hypothetical protein
VLSTENVGSFNGATVTGTTMGVSPNGSQVQTTSIMPPLPFSSYSHLDPNNPVAGPDFQMGVYDPNSVKYRIFIHPWRSPTSHNRMIMAVSLSAVLEWRGPGWRAPSLPFLSHPPGP